MNIIISTAKMKAEVLNARIDRLDIQYNYKLGEFTARVWYTDGSKFDINDMGKLTEVK